MVDDKRSRGNRPSKTDPPAGLRFLPFMPDPSWYSETWEKGGDNGRGPTAIGGLGARIAGWLRSAERALRGSIRKPDAGTVPLRRPEAGRPLARTR